MFHGNKIANLAIFYFALLGIYLIYKNEGFLSLWKGSLARVLYNAPTTAIIMSLMETFRSRLIYEFE